MNVFYSKITLSFKHCTQIYQTQKEGIHTFLLYGSAYFELKKKVTFDIIVVTCCLSLSLITHDVLLPHFRKMKTLSEMINYTLNLSDTHFYQYNYKNHVKNLKLNYLPLQTFDKNVLASPT